MKWFSRKIPDAAQVLKSSIEVENCRLETFSFDEEDLKWIRLRSTISHDPLSSYNYHLKAGKDYIRLTRDGNLWMSNTPAEIGTNSEFIHKAHGHVFIAGLGIGVIILPLLEAPEVKSITVVEIDWRVIEIFNQSSKELDISKLKIIEGDVFNPHKFLNGQKFDSLWFDIWISINSENYPETKELYKLYRKHINYNNKQKYVGFWMRDYIKRGYLAYH